MKVSISFQFGTVGSPISTPSKPGGSIGGIQRIVALGLDALELAWVQSVRVSEVTCQAINQAARDASVRLSVHAPYFINLNASEDEWPKSRQRLLDAAWYGWLAGATDIVFHPGSYFGKPPEEVLPGAIARLVGCVKELDEKGAAVTLRPETMGKSAVLGSLEDTLAMSREHLSVRPCLDFAHLHARSGDGLVNGYDHWMRILDAYCTALGDASLESLHIHLSGIEYGPKGERNHLPVRESDMDVPGLFQALKTSCASGRILCESPILEEDALYMQQLFEEIKS
jgi:deoxyribonuclease-4